MVGLSRFLIRPTVHCHNLASHLLGRALRALGGDFEARFGYRPWLVESFVETPHHSGACFRAANWVCVGETRGRGRQDRERAARETRKAIYVYALESDWRERLGVGAAPLGDQRLSKRLVDSARRQAEEPMRAFTGVAKNDWAAVKGYYRLIDQPLVSAVTPENILHPHRERTIRRMQAQDTVLCIQDGTDLKYLTRPQCTGLGVIGTNQTGAQSRGLHLHSTLAVSAEGLPLGVLRAQCVAPEPRTKAGAAPALEDKKTFRWIEGLRDCVAVAREMSDTRVISVMDREADFFDLFVEQRRDPSVELLVRAKHNRRMSKEHTLFEMVRDSPVRGRLAIAVGRQSARPKSSKKKVRVARAPCSSALSWSFSCRLRPHGAQRVCPRLASPRHGQPWHPGAAGTRGHRRQPAAS